MDLIKTILENQIQPEALPEIRDALTGYIENPDALIRELALRTMKNQYGKSEERRAALGPYYDRVQQKITAVYKTADAVWRGEYGNGDDHRRELIGPDYDLVKFRVNETRAEHGALTVDQITVKTDQGGRRYVLPDVPTALGIRDYHGYPQTRQGDNPYNFKGSGCGIASAYTCISTIKGYNMSLREFADRNLAAVGGTICPISTAIIERLLDREQIHYSRLRSFTTASLAASVKAHLQTGNPVILALTRTNRTGVNHRGRYANSEHYATLTHMHADGKRAFLLDSSGDPARGPRWVNLYDICDHVPTAKANEDFSPIWNGWFNCGGAVFVFMK
jgi:hypothetical protein